MAPSRSQAPWPRRRWASRRPRGVRTEVLTRAGPCSAAAAAARAGDASAVGAAARVLARTVTTAGAAGLPGRVPPAAEARPPPTSWVLTITPAVMPPAVL